MAIIDLAFPLRVSPPNTVKRQVVQFTKAQEIDMNVKTKHYLRYV